MASGFLILVFLLSMSQAALATSAQSAATHTGLQKMTGGTVTYNRTAAMAYAQQYWNVVTSDGYFWNGPSTYIPLAQGTSVVGMSGDDCAHFVSQAIGDEPNHPGGGLNIPSRVPPTYGEPGNAALGDLLLNNGWATQVSSVSQLMAGDVINYEWTSGAGWQHIAFYLGNLTVAAHTNSHYGANWTLGGAYAYRFIHILAPAGASLPSVSLNVSSAAGVAPLTTTATATPSGGSGTYSAFTFNWGDGSSPTTTTTSSAVHVYTAPGLFYAGVSVTDSAGNVGSSSTLPIDVTAPLTVSIGASTTGGNAPLNVSFTAAAKGGSASYNTFLWTFGDGTQSTTSLGSVNHVYTTPGSFNASCVVTDSNGTSAGSPPVTITVTPTGGSKNLSAVLAISPQSGSAPLVVQASMTASGGTGTYVSYVFLWGDGSAATTSTAGTATHTYLSPGNYLAGAYVSDSLGHTAWSSNVTIHVAGNATGSLTAALTISQALGDAPISISFHAQASGGSGSYSRFTWSFGDGTTASTAVPSTVHVYSVAGTYEASVVIGDTSGLNATSNLVSLEVAAHLSSTLATNASSGLAPLPTTLTLSLSGGTGPFTVTWNLGDGTTAGPSTSAGGTVTIAHTYPSAGDFNATASVEDASGDWTNSTVSVKAIAPASQPGQGSSPQGLLSSVDLWLVIGIAAVAAVGTIAVLRRRRRPETPPDYPWPPG